MSKAEESSSSTSNSILRAENGVLPGFEESEHSTKWQRDFYFIQAADTQLGLISNYGDGTITTQYPHVTWEREIELCKKSVEILNALEPRPAFFVVCGDLVDAFSDKWPEIRKQQEKDFVDIYKELHPEIKLVCVCGNHDVGNEPTRESVETYRQSFGDDHFSFWHGGVHFLVLNSQYYAHSENVPDLAKAHDDWLDQQLAESKEKKGSKHVVLFQHIPWFHDSPDEEDDYFNVKSELRKKMLDKLLAAGVRKVFCGHYHRNAGGWYKDELEVVVTTAIGCQIGPDTHGMRVVRVTEGEIKHEFHSLEDFPKKIEL